MNQCIVCRWWELDTSRCHRMPPQWTVPPVVRTSIHPLACWPQTEPSDWCGEWERQQSPVSSDNNGEQEPPY